MDQDDVSAPALDISQQVKARDMERKERNREYRVAARREKRNRKADEKKQRKLNATILRRMTRNPDKYNKNADRNRLRDIEVERRRIWQEAIRQAQRLAAVYDRSGITFNVGPVVKLEDGSVISQEVWRRRQEKAAENAATEKICQNADTSTLSSSAEENVEGGRSFAASIDNSAILHCGIHPDGLSDFEPKKTQSDKSSLSKTQLKKRIAAEPKAPPAKPTIPTNIAIPEGEDDWLALWDLSDEQLERRVVRAKKQKAAERKALRVKQQAGKAERRIARDEKRKVYRTLHLEWKAIKEEQTREKTKIKAIEEEESKKTAVEISVVERQAAMYCCSTLGFSLENTEGVEEIRPKPLGMKGVDVDFDAIEVGDLRSDIKSKASSKRIDLGNASAHARTDFVPTGHHDEGEEMQEYIRFDVGEEGDFETTNYNHKLRRKLRRAIDNAEIRKETLVRQRALDYFREKGVDVPLELNTTYKPVNLRGQRILENGLLETAKQERIRARVALTEFNTQMRVLRGQAKEAAVFAGLHKHAELNGKIVPSQLLTYGGEAV